VRKREKSAHSREMEQSFPQSSGFRILSNRPSTGLINQEPPLTGQEASRAIAQHVMLGVSMAVLICGFAEGSNHNAIYKQHKIMREDDTILIPNEIIKPRLNPWKLYSKVILVATIHMRIPSILVQLYGMGP